MATATIARLGFGPAKRGAEFFGISESLVRERAARGEWPSYCIGGRRVFDLDELVALVKKPAAERREAAHAS